MHSVRTNLSKGDVVRAALARLARPGALLKAWAVWTLVVAALMAFVRGIPRDATDALVLAISAAAGALISVAVSAAFVLLRVRGSLRPGDGVLGEHVYEVRDDGLHEKTAVNETLANWPGIKGTTETKAFAFIEMRSGSLHIIPKNSFSSTEHGRNFMLEVQRRAASDA